MIYFVLARIFAFLLDLIAIAWCSDHEKDLENLLLRQQLAILQRKYPHPPLSRLIASSGPEAALIWLLVQFRRAATTSG